MQHVLMIFAFLLGSTVAFAKAEPKLRMACTTSPYLTTSYVIYETPEAFDFAVIQHNGTEFMPIHSGTVTPHDLALLAKKAELLKKIGENAHVSFKKSECKNDGVKWTCSTHSQPQLGGLDVTSIYFSMGDLKSDYEGYRWNTTETYLSLGQKDGSSLTSTMSYQEGDCLSY